MASSQITNLVSDQVTLPWTCCFDSPNNEWMALGSDMRSGQSLSPYQDVEPNQNLELPINWEEQPRTGTAKNIQVPSSTWALYWCFGSAASTKYLPIFFWSVVMEFTIKWSKAFNLFSSNEEKSFWYNIFFSTSTDCGWSQAICPTKGWNGMTHTHTRTHTHTHTHCF